MTKRTKWTDYIQDMDRLSENLYLNFGDNITDYSTFEKAYNEYLAETNPSIKKKEFRDKAFNIYRKKYEGVSKGREVTKKTAEFLLEPELKQVRTQRKKFRKTGSVKKKIVRARGTTLQRKGKKIKVLRDKKGRFAKGWDLSINTKAKKQDN